MQDVSSQDMASSALVPFTDNNVETDQIPALPNIIAVMGAAEDRDLLATVDVTATDGVATYTAAKDSLLASEPHSAEGECETAGSANDKSPASALELVPAMTHSTAYDMLALANADAASIWFPEAELPAVAEHNINPVAPAADESLSGMQQALVQMCEPALAEPVPSKPAAACAAGVLFIDDAGLPQMISSLPGTAVQGSAALIGSEAPVVGLEAAVVGSKAALIGSEAFVVASEAAAVEPPLANNTTGPVQGITAFPTAAGLHVTHQVSSSAAADGAHQDLQQASVATGLLSSKRGKDAAAAAEAGELEGGQVAVEWSSFELDAAYSTAFVRKAGSVAPAEALIPAVSVHGAAEMYDTAGMASEYSLLGDHGATHALTPWGGLGYRLAHEDLTARPLAER